MTSLASFHDVLKTAWFQKLLRSKLERLILLPVKFQHTNFKRVKRGYAPPPIICNPAVIKINQSFFLLADNDLTILNPVL